MVKNKLNHFFRAFGAATNWTWNDFCYEIKLKSNIKGLLKNTEKSFSCPLNQINVGIRALSGNTQSQNRTDFKLFLNFADTLRSLRTRRRYILLFPSFLRRSDDWADFWHLSIAFSNENLFHLHNLYIQNISTESIK